MAEIQRIVVIATCVAIVVVFTVYFYYRGEQIMEEATDISPFVWNSRTVRLESCHLPFSNQSGKCISEEFCPYEELPKFLAKVLHCRDRTDYICCPTDDNVLSDPILKQFIGLKVPILEHHNNSVPAYAVP